MLSQSEFKAIFEQIRLPHGFPNFIDKLAEANIAGYVHFSSTGSINFYSREGDVISMRGHDKLLSVAVDVNKDAAMKAREQHRAGMTSYETFCREMAAAGVYKWIVDINEMTIRYESVDRRSVLVASISETCNV